MGKHSKKDKKIGIVPILIIIILILIGTIVSIKQQNSSSGGVSLNIDKDAGKFVPSPSESDNTPNVAIPGWGSLTIPANKTNVTVDFYNPEENEGLYYLTFELRLLDNSEQGYEVLYTSGLIEPGLHVQDITLSRGLEKGNHNAVIYVQPYHMDENKTPTNNAEMQTNLIVK